MMTVDELKTALPAHMKHSATQDLADLVNSACTDPEFARGLRENIVSYMSVLKEGRFKVTDYVSAVVYVSYKLMGYSNQDSYKRTFPQRYTDLVAAGADEKTISAYVSAYNKGKLVNLILEQSLIPIWVLNQDVAQKAINHLVTLMTTANSEKVQGEAAATLLMHLKKPESRQVELNLNLPESSGMKELTDLLGDLALKQRELIQAGMSTREIAHQKLVPSGSDIEGSAIDVTPNSP